MPKSITIHNPQDIEKMADNQKHPPQNIVGKCKKCGNCCEHYTCPAYDPKTRKCTIHEIRPIACRKWPHDQEDIDAIGCTGFRQQSI